MHPSAIKGTLNYGLSCIISSRYRNGLAGFENGTSAAAPVPA
jgi:hypothetical protein